MTRQPWQERIVGERMTMDDRFADRVASSPLSRQQWGLVMTAVEFEIADAEDPERARLVADTSKLEHVLPEMTGIDERMATMGGGPGGATERRGGIVDAIKGALGVGGDGGDAELEAQAAGLARAYAEGLQSLLEERGRWEEIREAAAAGRD